MNQEETTADTNVANPNFNHGRVRRAPSWLEDYDTSSKDTLDEELVDLVMFGLLVKMRTLLLMKKQYRRRS